MSIGLPLSSVMAATATTTMAISATVQATCVVGAAPVAFGVYTGVVAVATGTVTVTCTNSTLYNVGLDQGTFAGALVTTRRMTGPAGAALNYALTSDPGHATNWGNTTGTWVAGTGSGSGQPLTVYGQLGAGQYVAPGVYTDSITATVNY